MREIPREGVREPGEERLRRRAGQPGDDPGILDRILRLPEVLQAVGVSTATLYRWVEEGHFPGAVQLGKNSVGWRASEVQAWIESREPARGACGGC